MDSMEKHAYLIAKIQIGNVKGPLSYNQGQSVFHHDDIPESKRLRRNEIKAWTKSKTLNVDPPSWDKSSKTLARVIVRRQAENQALDRSKAYQFNYRAETLDSLRMTEPIDRPTKFHLSTQLESRAMELKDIRDNDRTQNGRFARTAEMPVHPDLVDKTAWNLSTEVNVKQKDLRLNAITDKSMQFTATVNSLKGTFSKPYKGPLKSAIALQNTIRQQKMDGTFSLKKHVNRPVPPPVDRKALKNRVPNEKLNKYSLHAHSGVFERSRVDGRSMWSDTGNEQFDSRGDVVRTVNLDALNIQGPSMSGRNKSKDIKGRSHSAPQSR
ncbi:hypothetical protein B484DRAFT_452735 [Ochromonadaceae sp. CCMP2298]|nr:hypothetical protein B484DRAFT_452735 [Ochromonadaceae sp. CCMP2298]